MISKEQEAVLNSPLVIHVGERVRIQKPTRSLLEQAVTSAILIWSYQGFMAVRCQHHGFLPIQATCQHLATVPVGDSMIRWFVGPPFFDASNPIIQGLKPLSSWMPDLADRIEQLNVWGFVGLFGHVWAMSQRFGSGDVVRLEQVL